MNEHVPPPDWESVFHRARRRMFGRLLLVGVIAAVGAGLLLNGGLAAQGSAPWLPINNETESKPKQGDEKHQGSSQKKQGQPQRNGEGHDHNGHKRGKKKPKQGGHGKPKAHKQWNPCGGDSAGTEYCDTPPKAPDGGPTGKTDASGGGVR